MWAYHAKMMIVNRNTIILIMLAQLKYVRYFKKQYV